MILFWVDWMVIYVGKWYLKRVGVQGWYTNNSWEIRVCVVNQVRCGYIARIYPR